MQRQDLAYKGCSTKCCPHFFSTRVQFFQCSTSIESVRWVWSVAQPRAKNKKTMTTRGNAMQYNAIQWQGERHGQQSNQYWRSCPYHSCCCQIGIICQVFQGSFQYQFWGFLWTLSISNKWCRASTKSTPPSTAAICIHVYMYTHNRGPLMAIIIKQISSLTSPWCGTLVRPISALLWFRVGWGGRLVTSVFLLQHDYYDMRRREKYSSHLSGGAGEDTFSTSTRGRSVFTG